MISHKANKTIAIFNNTIYTGGSTNYFGELGPIHYGHAGNGENVIAPRPIFIPPMPELEPPFKIKNVGFLGPDFYTAFCICSKDNTLHLLLWGKLGNISSQIPIYICQISQYTIFHDSLIFYDQSHKLIMFGTLGIDPPCSSKYIPLLGPPESYPCISQDFDNLCDYMQNAEQYPREYIIQLRQNTIFTINFLVTDETRDCSRDQLSLTDQLMWIDVFDGMLLSQTPSPIPNILKIHGIEPSSHQFHFAIIFTTGQINLYNSQYTIQDACNPQFILDTLTYRDATIIHPNIHYHNKDTFVAIDEHQTIHIINSSIYTTHKLDIPNTIKVECTNTSAIILLSSTNILHIFDLYNKKLHPPISSIQNFQCISDENLIILYTSSNEIQKIHVHYTSNGIKPIVSRFCEATWDHLCSNTHTPTKRMRLSHNLKNPHTYTYISEDPIEDPTGDDATGDDATGDDACVEKK